MSLRNRVVLPVIAVLALAFLSGCSSSSSGSGHVTPPPSGGFTNANLKGTYVFSFSGTDSNNLLPFAAVGTFTADGAGNISGGSFDVDDTFFGGPVQGVGVVTGSGYAITADGRGKGKLMTDHANVGNFGIDFVLTSSTHGLIIRFDGAGTGSGEFDLQSSSVTEANLTGYTFSLSGTDNSVNPMASVGTFTVDPTTGNITAGLQDINDINNLALNQTLTPNAPSSFLTLGTGTTAGTAALTTTSTFGTLKFDVWAVDATHLKMIETDGSYDMAGDLFTQQATLPTGTSTLVYTATGIESGGDTGLFSAGGYMSYDGTSVLSNGLEDFNLIDLTANSGNLLQATGLTGSMLAASGGGRYAMSLVGIYNGAGPNSTSTNSFAAYPFMMGSTVGMVFMETDGAGVTTGTAFVQSATTFGSGQGYGLNLTGFNPTFQGFTPNEVDDIAEFTVNSGGTLSNGVLDENNDPGSQAFKQALGTGGIYTYDSPATGRGTLSYPTAANAIGTLNLDFYTIDSSTVIFIDADQLTTTAQIGVGVFEQQSTPSSSSKSKAAAAASRTSQQFSMLNGIVHAKARRNRISK